MSLGDRRTQSTWFEPWGQADAIYVRIREIGNHAHGESYPACGARLADQLLHSEARRLVIDLRGNLGGDNSLNSALVRGLVRAQRFWRPGAMFVITDGATYSAAVDLSTTIEQPTPAIFVGSATGGSPNGYGDSRRLQLPSSGLTVRLSTRYCQGTRYQDKRLAIAPQLPGELSQADWIGGTDSELEQILNAVDAGSATGSWDGETFFRELSADLSITLAAAEDGSLDGVVRIPGVGLAEREFRVALDASDDWSGEIVLSGTASEISLLASGNHLRGWLQVNGRPYPIVAARRRR